MEIEMEAELACQVRIFGDDPDIAYVISLIMHVRKTNRDCMIGYYSTVFGQTLRL